jgi:hypothetical protein
VDEFGGEGDTLYVGGTHTRDLGKLHASRAAGRYARRASQSTQESRQEVPTQPSGGIDSSASMALSQLGLATTPTTETQGSSSRARDPSQLATLSTDSLATSSEDSFGSLESHTLEENLSWMERRGTLSQVIQCANEARTRSAERKAGPHGISRLLSHLQSDPFRLTAHDTPPASVDPHPGIHHSTTM